MVKSLKLGDATIKIGSGATPRGGKSAYVGSGTAFIRSQNVLDLEITLDGLAFIDEAAASKLAGVTVKQGDVLINITGDSTARVALWDLDMPARVNQHVSILRADPSLLNARWLQYWLVQPAVKNHLLVLASSGGSRPALTKAMLANLEVPLLPLTQQNKIATVLGSLDTKIAANNHAVAVIDETIQALWRAAVSSEAVFVRLDDVVELNPRTSVPKGTVLRTIEMKHLPESGFSVNEWVNREAKSGSRFQNGDTLLARITPCFENGKCGYVDFLRTGEIGAGSTEFIVLRPRPGVPPAVPYSIARSTDFRAFAEQTMTGTSGRQRVQHRDLGSYETSWPSQSSLTAFGSSTAPLLELAEKLRDASISLAKTRDELLPLLMDGKITVREAEQEATAAGVGILGEENEA